MIKHNGHILFLTMLFLTGTALADTHYVIKDNAGAASPFTDWTTAASNIQQAIDDALCEPDDTVMVAGGIYNTGARALASQLTNSLALGGGITNRVAVTKVITVRAFSTNWADTVIEGAPDPNTVSNGPAAIRGVYLTNGAALVGFTVTRGYAYSNYSSYFGCGGGVFCGGDNSVVSNCLIVSNYASCGAGFFGGTVRNCFIAINRARDSITSTAQSGYGGGGATLWGSSATIRDCVFSNNYGHRSGGGFYGLCRVYDSTFVYNAGNNGNAAGGGINGGGSGFVSNCVIMFNSAQAGGGGVANADAYGCLIANNYNRNNDAGGYHGKLIVNCTVVSNISATASMSRAAGVSGTPYITNCIIYFNYRATVLSNYNPNATSYYSCTYPAPELGDHNITNDPAFVDVAGKDYHLTPDSPCINKGINQGWMDTALDMDGHRRIIEGTVDIGAFEFLHRGTVFTGR
ncbi:MAG: choice-of-anchor Q domain-containing protein [Kiritimatiellae bacterium]|nr:choice-of-anchor Q domain-containing protein [Kiritimatiellia bacterium]